MSALVELFRSRFIYNPRPTTIEEIEKLVNIIDGSAIISETALNNLLKSYSYENHTIYGYLPDYSPDFIFDYNKLIEFYRDRDTEKYEKYILSSIKLATNVKYYTVVSDTHKLQLKLKELYKSTENWEKYEDILFTLLNYSVEYADELNEYFFTHDKQDQVKRFYMQHIKRGRVAASFYYGIYLCEYEKDYIGMMEYFTIASFAQFYKQLIDNYLISKYYDIEPDVTKVKQYYEVRIADQNVYAMVVYGKFYRDKEPNVELMKKYWSMAISKQSGEALLEMGKFVFEVEHDIEKALAYFELAKLYVKGEEKDQAQSWIDKVNVGTNANASVEP